MTPADRQQRFGFTLIELLVTVAVIAILARLLSGALSQAKTKGQSVICTGNLRQQSLGFKMAVDSDEGRLNRSYQIINGKIVDSTFETYMDTPLAKWWATEWGVRAKASVCPAAPERPLKDRVISPNFRSSSVYPGAFNAAWVIEASYDGWWLDQPYNPKAPEKRIGGYTVNAWLLGDWYWNSSELASIREFFRLEGDIRNPSQTPLFGDGIFWGFTFFSSGPRASDLPANNLASGAFPFSPWSMAGFTIPRHGSRPSTVLSDFPPSEKLPGAINVAFYDGHVETVKLERLWSLYWHRDYVPPAKRPGLK
jgi:prepilin-type N-terminal cleavage/methylation domain-containing protein/prepilin-type processing-associated H-X9-DG protein